MELKADFRLMLTGTPLQNHLNENIAIVSDRFHQTRARLIARKSGITSHIGCVNAETNWIYLPTFWVREWFGLPYDLFFR